MVFTELACLHRSVMLASVRQSQTRMIQGQSGVNTLSYRYALRLLIHHQTRLPLSTYNRFWGAKLKCCDSSFFSIPRLGPSQGVLTGARYDVEYVIWHQRRMIVLVWLHLLTFLIFTRQQKISYELVTISSGLFAMFANSSNKNNYKFEIYMKK